MILGCGRAGSGNAAPETSENGLVKERIESYFNGP